MKSPGEAKMKTHDTIRARYIACANAGMTQAQAARFLKVNVNTLGSWAMANPQHRFKTLAEKTDDLTPEQRRDIGTLTRLGGHTIEAAIAIVTKPKVKVRATP
jgi:hypothetical protein